MKKFIFGVIVGGAFGTAGGVLLAIRAALSSPPVRDGMVKATAHVISSYRFDDTVPKLGSIRYGKSELD